MNQDEAEKLISEKLKQARAIIKECEKLAEDNEVEFGFSVAYGMGGFYVPKALNESPYRDAGWQASSQSC